MNLGINGGIGCFFKHKNNHTVVVIFIVLKINHFPKTNANAQSEMGGEVCVEP